MRNVRERLRRWYHGWLLRRGISRLRRCVEDGRRVPPRVFDLLLHGWENVGWVARRAYLRTVLHHALQTEGPILECGSGVTSLVLGVVADARDLSVVSLEHDPGWFERLREVLTRAGIRSVDLRLAPLVDHGGFSWYDFRGNPTSRPIRLVVCDGPPGDTPGGRSGLLPVMSTHLHEECIILLDDAGRSDEQEALEKWARDYGIRFRIHRDANLAVAGWDTSIFDSTEA